MSLPKDDFIQLRDEWYQRLKESGFKDIEDKKGYLKQYDRRTIAFENREAIAEFFTRLTHWLTEHPDIPPLHKMILSLYCEGVYATEIARRVERHKETVKEIIRDYRKTILSEIAQGVLFHLFE